MNHFPPIAGTAGLALIIAATRRSFSPGSLTKSNPAEKQPVHPDPSLVPNPYDAGIACNLVLDLVQ
jgi:hypothetical protein